MQHAKIRGARARIADTVGVFSVDNDDDDDGDVVRRAVAAGFVAAAVMRRWYFFSSGRRSSELFTTGNSKEDYIHKPDNHYIKYVHELVCVCRVEESRYVAV